MKPTRSVARREAAQSVRRCKRWTPHEDAQLAFCWGTFAVKTIAQRLGRTSVAVIARSFKLQLGAPSRGRVSLCELAEQTGYCRRQIERAVQEIGITPHHAPLGSFKRAGERRARSHHRRLDDEQIEQVLAFLKARPDGEPFYSRASGYGRAGEWGSGAHPPACLECGTTKARHKAKGKCKSCYDRGLPYRNRVSTPPTRTPTTPTTDARSSARRR